MMRTYKTPPGRRPGTLLPHKWASGPDPELHRRYKIWAQQKNQAQWRGESWDLAFEDWVEIWGDDFDRKGRGLGSLCMTRRDLELPWTRDNVIIITREQHFLSNRNKDGKFKTREK